MKDYAGVIINSDAVKLDKIFTYKIPQNLYGKLKVGMWVKVPFGKLSRKTDAFIVKLYDEALPQQFKIKDIEEICYEIQLFTDNDLKVIEYMRSRYLCTYIEAIRLFIPKGILKGGSHKEKDVLYIGKNQLSPSFRKEPYESIVKVVMNNEGMYSISEIGKIYGLSISSINTLIKHGVIEKNKKTVYRYSNKIYDNYEKRILNCDQRAAVEKVITSNFNVFLLKGVTGSGKTEVYMNIIEYYMKFGKNSIMLVPEIALTPQMVERFKGRFGKNVAVFHSRLSDGERFDEWHRVKNGEVQIAIGARSAIFLPFDKLGTIIIDEEHESSYKSESDPKFDAREIAEFKSLIEGCKVIFGSATPSIENYYKAKEGKIGLIELDNRADNASMPEIDVVDMRDELKSGNKSMFSKSLKEAMDDALNRKEQIILFLNRRGFSSFVSCRKCGYVFKCKHCDISMTYHARGYLSCHYCGNKEPVRKTCPQCGSHYVKQFGVGTEKVERALKLEYPNASVIRMDFDTTRGKDSYEKIYNDFKNKKADILVGTQMVAKGLDFKDVTVVGVLAADLSLNMPDYKAGERTFQLLTQVSGRAGRGSKKGKVIIQTYMPNNYAILRCKNYDYEGFFKDELNLRKMMNYPPYSNIVLLNMSSKNESLLIKTIQNIGVILKSKFKDNDNIDILGPCPCGVSRIKEFYRWQIVIKGNVDNKIAEFIKSNAYKEAEGCYNEIRISIDINPNNLI